MPNRLLLSELQDAADKLTALALVLDLLDRFASSSRSDRLHDRSCLVHKLHRRAEQVEVMKLDVLVLGVWHFAVLGQLSQLCVDGQVLLGLVDGQDGDLLHGLLRVAPVDLQLLNASWKIPPAVAVHDATTAA